MASDSINNNKVCLCPMEIIGIYMLVTIQALNGKTLIFVSPGVGKPGRWYILRWANQGDGIYSVGQTREKVYTTLGKPGRRYILCWANQGEGIYCVGQTNSSTRRIDYEDFWWTCDNIAEYK